jgi:trimethylamine--corrinoid protein Co-methyltransferase
MVKASESEAGWDRIHHFEGIGGAREMIRNDKGGIAEARFLTREGMEKVHEQTLLILERTGIGVDDDTALQMLADGGAKVDQQAKTVTFPAELVERCLATVPRRITLAGRNPDRDLLLEPGGKMRTRNAGGMTQVHDLETGNVRDAMLADVADFCRLLDGLEHIDYVAPVYPADAPSETLELYVLETMLASTDKHINMRALTPRNLPYIVAMGEVVAGGKEQLKERPVISILEAPISPLKFPDVFIDALFLGGEYGIPVEICSMPNFGATGPMTLAGALLLSAVEHLATIVISQLAHPGAPLIWASRFASMDMSTGMTGMSVEGAIASAAAAQLATEYYDLVCNLHGPATNSIIPDGESVFDECVGAYVTGFAGRPSVLCGAASLGIGMTASFEEAVISNELHSVVRTVVDGFEVTDETLGADAISRVGIGGNYLTDPHTMKYLRSKRHDSPFMKAKTGDTWASSGSKGYFEMARERARAILKEHQPTPLDEGVAARLREVIKDAEKDFGVK